MKAQRLLLPLALFSGHCLANSVQQALQDTQVKLNFRYRLEQVNPDNTQETALASTLRSRVALQTGAWQIADSQAVKALVEYDNVSSIGGETYNTTTNSNTGYATVADPTGTDLNVAALLYSVGDSTLVTLGRQRVNLLNQRFVGSVGWRQNEQTFDGIRLEQKFNSQWQLDVASLHNANRVFGPSGSTADLHGRFNTAQLGWSITPKHAVTGFVIDLDFDTLASRSSRTSGLDYQGGIDAWKWQLSVATQKDAHQAPTDVDTNYHRFEASYAFSKVTVKAWQERLGSDGSNAFQTPLATLHAFQGFADLFLTTPSQGLRENALQVLVPINTVKTTISYHQFDADVGDAKLGSEWDATVSYDLTKNLQLLGKVAFYNADSFQVDTNKFWLMATYQL